MSSDKEKVEAKILDGILKDLNLESLVNTAIINALNDETKNKLIENITEYLSSDAGRYSSKTILQDAFEKSIHEIVRQQMTVLLNQDERILNEVRKAVAEATQRFIDMDKEGLIQNLVNSLTKGFTVKDRYE